MTQKFNPYKTFAHDGKALSQYKEVPLWECPKCGGKVDTRMELVRDHKCPEEEKTMTQKPEITATAIYKIIGHDCWMVPSDSSSDMHKVCYNTNLNIWECECRHGEEMAKYARNAHCKHVAAVQISIKANLPVSTDQKGLLHSASGKAFSLMR